MGASIRGGLNWSCESDVYSFFGLRGYVDGKNWAVPFFGSALVEVDPAPVSDEILKIIAEDTKAGNADKIAYIGVEPFVALRLALEGVLTLDLLAAATETVETITVKVVLGGKEYELVISSQYNAYATYDKNDEIV